MKRGSDPSARRLTGKVKYFNRQKGFGLIRPTHAIHVGSKGVYTTPVSRKNIFFEHADIPSRRLKAGQRVEFLVVDAPFGSKAAFVRVIGKSIAGALPRSRGSKAADVRVIGKKPEGKAIRRALAMTGEPKRPGTPTDVKLHELAKEMDVTSKTLLEKAIELGIKVKSHAHLLTPGQADRLRVKLGGGKKLKADLEERKTRLLQQKARAPRKGAKGAGTTVIQPPPTAVEEKAGARPATVPAANAAEELLPAVVAADSLPPVQPPPPASPPDAPAAPAAQAAETTAAAEFAQPVASASAVASAAAPVEPTVAPQPAAATSAPGPAIAQAPIALARAVEEVSGPAQEQALASPPEPPALAPSVPAPQPPRVPPSPVMPETPVVAATPTDATVTAVEPATQVPQEALAHSQDKPVRDMQSEIAVTATVSAIASPETTGQVLLNEPTPVAAKAARSEKADRLRVAAAIRQAHLATTPVLQRSEGRQKEHLSKRYERDPKNRQAAIAIHGLNCVICGFNFEEHYGDRGIDFIEVHHHKPVSRLGGDAPVDPRTDLAPTCSNCHRMIHRWKDDPLSIEEMKGLWTKHHR